MKKFFTLMICMAFLLLCGCVTTSSSRNVLLQKPLKQHELITLVSGNSIIGTTCHTHALYELYFSPNGQLDFYKNHAKQQFYQGQWWVTGNIIHSQWKTYLKKPTENQLLYYHIMNNVYVPYNINEACGHAGTFGMPFIMVKGKVVHY